MGPLELLEPDDFLDDDQPEMDSEHNMPAGSGVADPGFERPEALPTHGMASNSDTRVDEWLHSNGLAMFAGVFAEHMIEFEVLPDLDDADLRELNITAVGARKKILKA